MNSRTKELINKIKPISAREILYSSQLQTMVEEYKNMFRQIAIEEYNPNDDNIYKISKCNEYTYKLNSIEQDGNWQL